MQQPAQRGPHDGQTRRDDGEPRLDGRPHDGAGVVPGAVVRRRKGRVADVDGLHDGDDEDEGAEQEDAEDLDAARAGGVHAPDEGHGEREHDGVGGGAERGARQQRDVEAEAAAGDGGIPVALDGAALEE